MEEKNEHRPSADDAQEHDELNTASSNEPIASSESIPEKATQPASSNQQPATDMEVHHHAHDPAAPHHKKNWKSYFWEFLMLFLAVFCGFLAEYQLEHKIEKDREKVYMNSMLEDLKSDTLQLSSNSIARLRRVKMIDSLIELLSKNDFTSGLNDIYYFGRSLTLNIDFFPNDRTILQLKNSGSLRLIHNTVVSNGIMHYDQKMRSLVFLLTQEQQQRMEYRKIASNVFDGTVFNRMIDNYDTITKPTNNPALFDPGPAGINELMNHAQYLKKVDMNQIKKAGELKSLATELISLIMNEYHLE